MHLTPATAYAPTALPEARLRLPDPSALVAAFTGLMTTFIVSLVGEMPLGEVVLLGVNAFLAVHALLFHRLPGALWSSRLLWVFLACQLVALGGYVASDLLRESSPRDMLRGWARMVFLAGDLTALAVLLGYGLDRYAWFMAGLVVGEPISAILDGQTDWWKFVWAVPVTTAVLGLASLGGRWGAIAAAFTLSALHAALDYRSLGIVLLLIGALLVVQAFPPRGRPWMLPGAALLAAAMLAQVMAKANDYPRASRSNVERSAMLEAAWDAFARSPVLGHGSWFSNTRVTEDFLARRFEKAKLASVGGFSATEDHGIAIHSQGLVALAEGGIFGAAFFAVYGAALLWAVWYCVVVRPWSPLMPVMLFTLTTALWNLAFSPFSGPHRIYIALAATLVVALRVEARQAREGEGAA